MTTPSRSRAASAADRSTGVPPMSWDDARAAAHAAVAPMPARELPAASALGAVLAVPVRAAVDSPLADRAAMDGYAVCGEPPWLVVARLRAGEPGVPPLSPGTACEIVTGAPVPAATTAVLPYEQSSTEGDRLTGAVRAGRHIRRAGEEFRAGDEVLPAGRPVTPAVLGLLATLGRDTVRVHQPPAVESLVTGDELVHSGTARPGMVRDAIGPMLPGLVAAAGGRPRPTEWLPDDAGRLADALARGTAPLVLVSGSSSRGPADHLRPVLDGLGARRLVDGVHCRPGHPQALARLADGRVVVGLPGNPYAALVAFHTLAVPVLAGLRGLPLPTLPELPADPAWAPRPGLTRVLPAVREGERLRRMPYAGSAMLRGAALADALVVVTPDGRARAHPLAGRGS
jgi:molybdopterin molybdotransferase